MGFLFRSPKTNAAGAPKLTQMLVQSSAFGLPIPIVCGTTRISCNLGWYGGFQAVTVNNPVAGGGGKGGVTGGGGKGGSGGTTTTYRASLIALLGEGPISGVFSAWISQTHLTGAPNFSVVLGNYGQAPWTYLTTNFPSDALPYSGVAYLAAANYDLGTSANLPGLGFEVQALFAGTAPGAYGGNGCATGGDALCDAVIKSLLTDPNFGIGFPLARFGRIRVARETKVVPALAPLSITVDHATAFNLNLCVVDNAGNVFTCSPTTPTGPGNRYAVSAGGVYTFSGANAGKTVTISYAWLDVINDYADWCLANSLWISPAIVDQAPASQIVGDIAEATFSDFVWSAGALFLLPRGASSVTGNGHTYTPPSQAEFFLTDDDFIDGGSDLGPIQISRRRISDQINAIKIECLDRANQYAPTVVDHKDDAGITRYGLRPATTKSYHFFCDVSCARVSAQFLLQNELKLDTFGFTLDPRYVVCDPGDIIAITDSAHGLTNFPVRITDIQENEDGSFAITAEEWPGNIGKTADYNLNTGSGYVQDFNADPGLVNTPFIVGAPPALAATGPLEMWCGLSGANPALFGGAQVWAASQSGGPYKLLDDFHGQSRMGVTTSDLAVGIDPDVVNTVAVNLTESAGQLDSGTQADADNANTLCVIGGANGVEWVSYEIATLTSANHYTLGTYLRRGLYSSPIVDHPPGAQFMRGDQLVFRIPYEPAQIGRMIYLKFVAFNIYGGGLNQIDDAVEYAVPLPAPPPPPNVKNFRAAQRDAVVNMAWTALVDVVGLKGYDIAYAPQGTTDWDQFTLLSRAEAGSSKMTSELPPGNWTLAIRARDIANQLSPLPTYFDIAISTPSLAVSSVEESPGWGSHVYSGGGNVYDTPLYRINCGPVTDTPAINVSVGRL